MSGLWTDEEVELVAGMLRKGMSASQIAGEMGVTRNAVIGRVDRNKRLAEVGFHNKSGGYTEAHAAYHARQRQERKPRVRRVKQSKIAGVLAAPKPKEDDALPYGNTNAFMRVEKRLASYAKAHLPRVAANAVDYDAATRKVALVELTVGDCKWIVEECGEHARFCAEPALVGRSWCPHHHRRAFQGVAA